MAITFDRTLGSSTNNGPFASFTTSGATASNARVVVVMSWFQTTPGTASCTIGGTAATLDKQFNNGSDCVAILSLVVSGVLASGSTIAPSISGTANGGTIAAACSYNATTSVDTTGTNTGTTSASWSTGSLTCALADSLYVGVAGTDGSMTSESSTPTNGNERFDIFFAAVNQGAVMQDLIVSAVGSNAITGTWGTTTGLTTQTMGVVIYKGTASAATTQTFVPSRFPLGA